MAVHLCWTELGGIDPLLLPRRVLGVKCLLPAPPELTFAGGADTPTSWGHSPALGEICAVSIGEVQLMAVGFKHSGDCSSSHQLDGSPARDPELEPPENLLRVLGCCFQRLGLGQFVVQAACALFRKKWWKGKPESYGHLVITECTVVLPNFWVGRTALFSRLSAKMPNVTPKETHRRLAPSSSCSSALHCGCRMLRRWGRRWKSQNLWVMLERAQGLAGLQRVKNFFSFSFFLSIKPQRFHQEPGTILMSCSNENLFCFGLVWFASFQS